MVAHIIALLLLQVLISASAQSPCGPCSTRGCYVAHPSPRCALLGNIHPNSNACFKLKCTKSLKQPFCATWSPVLPLVASKRCKNCTVCNDPHFKSYDDKYFDFHGKCNYTLTQKTPTLTNLIPDYAVFSKFRDCSIYNPAITCLDITVYREDPFTVITVDHSNLPNFKINGGGNCLPSATEGIVCSSPTTYHPVDFWTYGSCLWFQGTKFTVEICPGCTRIWAHVSIHFNTVGGLCGILNSNTLDDFTDRSGTVQTSANVNVFGESWRANTCIHPFLSASSIVQRCAKYNDYEQQCRNAISQGTMNTNTYEALIKNCATDMCNDERNKDFWLKFNVGVIKEEQGFLPKPKKPCFAYRFYVWICYRKRPRPANIRDCAMKMCDKYAFNLPIRPSPIG